MQLWQLGTGGVFAHSDPAQYFSYPTLINQGVVLPLLLTRASFNQNLTSFKTWFQIFFSQLTVGFCQYRQSYWYILWLILSRERTEEFMWESEVQEALHAK